MTKRRSSLATKGRSKKFTAFTAEPASWEKKIDDLPGIGQKTSAKLKDKGIEYVSKRLSCIISLFGTTLISILGTSAER